MDRETTKSTSIEPKMKLIPSGTFKMGAEGWGEFESPIHEVYIDAFYIDIYPVTNKEYNEFVLQTNYITTSEKNGAAIGYENGILNKIRNLSWKSYYTPERENHPVVLISWFDAEAYASWAGKRLPTEAEWEKAARGGLENKIYPWGNDEPTDTHCNFGKMTTHFPATTPVGSYAPNGYGLFDMCGNVWNWCNDWFSESGYTQQLCKNPVGPERGLTKIRRGASFNIVQPFRLRTSNRGAYDPHMAAINIGFRCAKS